MKLNREDIFPGHSTGKCDAVVRFPCHVGAVVRKHIIRVNKVKIRTIRNAPKNWRVFAEDNLVPPHVRDFQAHLSAESFDSSADHFEPVMESEFFGFIK